MEHEIWSEQLGVMAAKGNGVVVMVDYGKNEKVAVPDVLRERIAKLENWEID